MTLSQLPKFLRFHSVETMSAEVQQHIAADAAGGSILKRKVNTDDLVSEPANKIPRTEDPPQTSEPPQSAPPVTEAATATTAEAAAKGAPMTKAREVRLEQNRKAARESRKRKKVMIEELQRSVIFFSRANGTLKQQNDHLTRLLIQAQSQIASIESGSKEEDASAAAAANATVAAPAESKEDQAQAQAVATQAMYESQGFPAAAARAAAQTMSGSSGVETSVTATALPPMQPGATMQAMANFQQAAAAAMQNAMQGMASIPGLNMSALAATPVGANAQQAYTDTMTALAMQQAAAAAAAGQQFAMQAAPGMTPFMANTMLWGQQAQQPAVPATATAPTPPATAAAPGETKSV